MTDNTVKPENLPESENVTISDALQDITSTMPEVSEHVVNMPQPETPKTGGETVADVKKKRGRPKKTDSDLKTPRRPSTLNAPQATPTADPMMTKATEAMTNLIQVFGLSLGGSDAIMQPDERVTIKKSFEDYFTAKGVIDLPPSIALIFGISGYAIRVAVTPPAKSKFQLFGAWIKHKISSIKGKRRYATQPDNRDDDKRQDNTR